MSKQDIKPLFNAIETNLSISHGAITTLQNGLSDLKNELNKDISKRESDLNNLSYLARDIKDNFKFTLSLVDEINKIDELINQINILAINIALEVSKSEDINLEIFGDIAKDIREKSDKVQNIIEKIFTKEVKNKSFSEHNRYIQNSVLPLINERVESLGDYLNNKDEIFKSIKQLEDITVEISHTNSGNRDMIGLLSNLIEEHYQSSEQANRNSGVNEVQAQAQEDITKDEKQSKEINNKVKKKRVVRNLKSKNREIEQYIPEF